jgi:hypothetical protein
MLACSHAATPARDGPASTESEPDDAAVARDAAAARDGGRVDEAASVAIDAATASDVAPASSADGPPATELGAPRTVVLDGAKLAAARSRLPGDAVLAAALAKLKARADAALTAGPWSVVNKTTTPPSGDKHDYISLARYYWPSTSANGCPYVHKDGETNPDTSSNKYDHAARHAAMNALFDLAMTWYFTGDARYAQRAALVAHTWFLDAATAMNPNVNFGEGVPCLRDGTDTGVLNWTELIGEALDALAVLDLGAPGWSAADQTAMRAWLTKLLAWLQTNALAKSEAAATNNHGTWYDVGTGEIMLYLGQTDAAKTLLQASTSKRIASQIKGDGSQPQELARTNSWGYSNWNAEGMCLLAQAASHAGVDIWGYTAPGGGTVAKTADYLIAGATQGKAAWTHGQISPFEPSWPLSLLHAAADFANDTAARAAIPMVPVPPEGDLWPLLPVCLPAAIQVN